MQKSYLLNPENSKTILILSQPKMCQKYKFLLTRAHFLGATGAPTEPVHESLLKTPILSRPTMDEYLAENKLGSHLKFSIVMSHVHVLIVVRQIFLKIGIIGINKK